MNRRAFLKSAAISAAAIQFNTISRAADAQPMLIGTQMYGWGQYYEREHKPFNLDEIFSALRDAGYDYADGSFDATHMQGAADFADKLRAKGLKTVSMYSGARLHEAGKSEQIAEKIASGAADYKETGFKILVVNPDPIGREKTDAELETQVKNLELIGDAFRKQGLFFAIHNHTPEMANHQREFHYNFDKTDPRSVKFCYDVHWVFRGGIQPADALRQYGDRVVTWHLRQSRNGVWLEDLDTGDIDYAWIGQYAKDHGLSRNYTVEIALENQTKITRSSVENHRRSIEFVRKTMS